MGRVILIGGGVRSGKSAFAVAKAIAQPAPRIYIATAERRDAEMEARADQHIRERGDAFETIEEPRALEAALARCASASVVVIDCLTLWLSNRLLSDESSDSIIAALGEVLHQAKSARADTLFVTNEVGMGIVPETLLGRQFRDLSGAAHQTIAGAADEIYLAAVGVVTRLHPSPVEVVRFGRQGLSRASAD